MATRAAAAAAAAAKEASATRKRRADAAPAEEASSSTRSSARKKAKPIAPAAAAAASAVDEVAGAAAASSSSSAAAAAASSSPSSASAAAVAPSPLLLSLRRAMLAAADAAKGTKMRSYLKSALPCYGVYSEDLKAINKEAFENVQFDSHEQWAAAVREIWLGATHREEKHSALALARHSSADAFRFKTAALPLYAELASSGAWWDFVDDLASHHIGEVLRNYPANTKAELTRWSKGQDMWLRRCAIIAQLNSKGNDMDLQFLFRMCEAAMASEEFFLRKAIGWGLRQAARQYPREIQVYVAAHETQLSDLSKREALKHVGKLPKSGVRAPKI